MKISISEETKSKVKQLSFSEHGSSFVPVSFADYEIINPTISQKIPPISLWFIVESTLYEYLTPSNFTQPNYTRVLNLCLKSPSFKLFIRSADNISFLRFVEECKKAKYNSKPQEEKIASDSISTLKNKVKEVFATISSDLQLKSESMEYGKEAVKEVINTISQQPKLAELLVKVLSVDGNYITHSTAVTIIASALANKLKLPDQHIKALALGALFHDVGLFKIPSRLANCIAQLSGDELEIYQAHTIYGQEMLDDLTYAGVKVPSEIEVIALQHHEKFNGCGYPNHKRGRQEEEGPSGIHLFARIVSLADSYHEQIEKCKKDNEKISSAEVLMKLSKKDGCFDPVIFSKLKEISLGV